MFWKWKITLVRGTLSKVAFVTSAISIVTLLREEQFPVIIRFWRYKMQRCSVKLLKFCGKHSHPFVNPQQVVSENRIWMSVSKYILVEIFHNNWSFQSCWMFPCSWINPASNLRFYSPLDHISIWFSAFRQVVSIANINWEVSNTNEILVLIQLKPNSRCSLSMDLFQMFFLVRLFKQNSKYKVLRASLGGVSADSLLT